MRPYFAPRLSQSSTRQSAPEPATAAELRAAWAALVTVTRPHWPGGQPTRADLDGMKKCIAARFSVPVEAVVTALSTEA